MSQSASCSLIPKRVLGTSLYDINGTSKTITILRAVPLASTVLIVPQLLDTGSNRHYRTERLLLVTLT